MLRLNLALPSGKRKHLEVAESSKVGDLKALAQQSLGHRFLSLVTVCGKILPDPEESLQAAGLRDGDHLWCCGERIITWGHEHHMGCGQQYQCNLLQTVQAFAAILADGSVATWGHELFGGHSLSKIS